MDKVVHFEIPADQVERAKRFYEAVFNWNAVSIPKMKYVILRTGPTDEKGMAKESGFINGGILRRQAPIDSAVITINVASIEDSSKKIEANGGKMIKGKFQVGEMGYAAYFRDTESNIIGLWENIKKIREPS